MDASNAFYSINKMSALHNIKHLCPSLATILIICYRSTSQLFIDGDTIYSQEGTTRGDPLSMPMYAVATVPLIKKLTTSMKQMWYTDNTAATRNMSDPHVWWDEISHLWPSYGCNTNVSKTWLVIKKEFQEEADAIFGNTQVKITRQTDTNQICLHVFRRVNWPPSNSILYWKRSSSAMVHFQRKTRKTSDLHCSLS